ncbi:MAG: hypothetical protein ACI92W_003077, partial [Paraglaciecola sp.]
SCLSMFLSLFVFSQKDPCPPLPFCYFLVSELNP